MAALLGLVALAATAGAQHAGPRAWQQRLQVDIPLPVPLVSIEAANPFASAIDEPPHLATATAPRRLDVTGKAVAAAYVDAKGECLGAVPLELPFPGLTSALVDALTGSRFEPAHSGTVAKPSWSVIEVSILGKVKESSIVDQSLELPDPTAPPEPSVPERVSPSGNLVNMPTTPANELSSLAAPKRVKVKLPGRDTEFTLKALVHLTAEGRCDRYVPLELDSGFERWLSAFLATWRANPATRDGEPVNAWMVYTARVQLRLSGLESTTFRALTDRTYDPNDEPPTQ